MIQQQELSFSLAGLLAPLGDRVPPKLEDVMLLTLEISPTSISTPLAAFAGHRIADSW